jgi:hypothetical protein
MVLEAMGDDEAAAVSALNARDIIWARENRRF